MPPEPPLAGRAVLEPQAEALGVPCRVDPLAALAAQVGWAVPLAACGPGVLVAASGQALRPSGAQAAADLLVGQAPLQMC